MYVTLINDVTKAYRMSYDYHVHVYWRQGSKLTAAIMLDDLMYLENIREYVEDHKTIVNFLVLFPHLSYIDDFCRLPTSG